MNIPLWISSSIVLDARRAVWFPREQTLAIANLYLGWRPQEETPARDETVAQLLALAADYQPQRIVLLGHLIHPQADHPVTGERFRALIEALEERTGVVITGDPEDEPFLQWLKASGWEAGVVPRWHCGKHHLLHRADAETPPGAEDPQEPREGARCVIASERPGITLGEAAPVCCPCFLLADGYLLLPTFSPWACPRDFREEACSSPTLKRLAWRQAIAIAAGKLVPVDL